MRMSDYLMRPIVCLSSRELLRKCILVILLIMTSGVRGEEDYFSDSKPKCPTLVSEIFSSSTPAGKLEDNSSIIYDKVEDAVNFRDCINSCCQDSSCNDVFIFNQTSFNCFKVRCIKDELCLPVKASGTKFKNSAFVILVRPTNHETWDEVIENNSGNVVRSSTSLAVVCEVGLDLEACHENEECVPVSRKSRNGVCRCKTDFVKNEKNQCVPAVSTTTIVNTEPPVTKITVEIASKNITLPENSATLTAFAIPTPPKGETYEYEWKLLSNQTSGSMRNSHTQTLVLSDLDVGTYQFKVTVTGKSVYGEAFGNVTVRPRRRINRPPVANVTPEFQNITLPTKKAIIDGSASSDDNKSQLKYKWELTTGPLGYQPPDLSNEGPTLTLDNLIAGNYTVNLTVIDSDGVTDSAVAFFTVVEETDYPPTANAGEDIIIYLPLNHVTLHGNQSTDDHGITSWEWTRPPSQKELAADTQNMRTPHPHISNLELGTYTFTLKVTDAKGQSAEDEVNVYVKPPINLPPKADAGEDIEISLPKTWVILDGSKSKDDINITSYKWLQISGPKDSRIVNPNNEKTNVTDLTKGVYKFNLTVTDNLGNTNNDSVLVTVNQDTNSAPVAVAGDDFVVTLPVSGVAINGSGSHDDLGIVRWEWTRDANSLAAGKIVGNSSHEPVLYLVDVVPGQYIFQLKIWDEQGKSSVDSVSINVHENPDQLNVIQVVLNENMNSLTQNRLETICQRIRLLLPKNDAQVRVELLDLVPQLDSNSAVMHFVVKEKGTNDEKEKIMSGVKVVETLKAKLKADSDLLELKVLELDTLICQNKCSGHGTCHQATRSCICEPFWIENFVRRQLMDGKSNCEWSIIYVGIFLAVLTIVIFCGVIVVTCKKKKNKKTRMASRRRYTRLDQKDHETVEMKSTFTSSLMESETESDDEILFQNINGNGGSRNGLSNGGSVIVKRTNGYANSNPEI